MRVCLHTNWEIAPNFIGGTERFLISIAKELQVLGYDPFIVCSSKTEEIYIEGIKVIGRFIDNYSTTSYPYFSSNYIKKEIIGDQYSLESLRRLSNYTSQQICGIDAEIFHFNSFISTSFIEPKNNYLVTNHENNHEYDWYWGSGFWNFFSEAVRNHKTKLHRHENLFCPSNFYAQFFSEELNLKIRGINLGISLDNFPVSLKQNSLRHEYGIEENDVIILLPSRFQPFQKGHDVALKACHLLKEKGIRFQIIFTGVKKSSEKYMSSFDSLVFEYKLQKHVKVITFPYIQEAYNNVDIIISPERYCSYGLSISETLALGIPTILSDIPTYKEIAKDFDHAYFFKSESAEDLALKIIKISLNPCRNSKEAILFRMKNDLRRCATEYSQIYLDSID